MNAPTAVLSISRVSDTYNHILRRVRVRCDAEFNLEESIVSTLAGSPEPGFADGLGMDARFNEPVGITADTHGNIFVCDSENESIRKVVLATGEVSTIAGNGRKGMSNGQGAHAQFDWPACIAVDTCGNMIVSELGNDAIRQVTPDGRVSTIAGGSRGFEDGDASTAKFSSPQGIAVDGNNTILIADKRQSQNPDDRAHAP